MSAHPARDLQASELRWCRRPSDRRGEGSSGSCGRRSRLSHCEMGTEIGPCFGSGQGSPSFHLLSSSLLEIEGPMARRQGARPGSQAGCGTARGRALGVKRHAPRLRRANGHLGLRLLNVEPTRSCLSLGVPERRPWVVCVIAFRRCPPAPRLTNASGRRPPNTDRDRWPISKFHYEVKRSNLSCERAMAVAREAERCGPSGFAPEDRIRRKDEARSL